ncbi:MAG TPA: ATP-binding protein [Kofleriaceae bacterium]|nr:ATP-binding protein [Kofleriaceae bacterium]
MRYAWALIAVIAALLARWFADPRLGTQLPYGSMLVASVVVAWFGGVRPALVVVLLGGPAANYFLLPPRWSFAPGIDKQSWGLVVFLFLGSVIALFGGYVHTQRARAEATADAIRRADAALREARDDLERRVRERTAELAHTNESLRASEERFRLLVEGVKGYAIVMLDAAGAIVAWNGGAERLFGRSADIVGAAIATLIPGLDGPALHDTACAGSAEREAVGHDGATFPIELDVTRLDPHGMFIGIVRDISERKRLEALTEQRQRRADELRKKSEELEADNRRMQEAARLQSEFLANMSHELRTPLNAIIGFADLMYRGLAGPVDAQHREFLGDILTSSRHLLQLISDVLDLSKIESGALEVVPEPVELARLIGDVRDILRGMAGDRKIELELELVGDLGSVTVDPAKLRQILYNYISNALKFTPEGGRVTLRASLAGDTFRVEVEDTGVGIAAADQRYLFTAFRQLDSSATKRYPGAGLGLALTKRLAEAHGGTVGVHSAPGAGSTFWVELPRATAAARPSTRS